VELEWVPEKDWVIAERAWILYGWWLGWDLTNGTAGGDGGTIAASWSDEARAKRVARGYKPMAEETKEKIRQAKKGKHYGTSVPPNQYGSDVKNAKLTEDLVVELRRYAKAGGNVAAWGRAHSVTPQAAWLAATGKSWPHVSETPKQ
jgi:hypothetical protein